MLTAPIWGRQARQLLTPCLVSIYLGARPAVMKVLTGYSLVPSPRPLLNGRRWKLACVATRILLSGQDHRAPWSPVARPWTQAGSTTAEAAARWWDEVRTESRRGAQNPAATRTMTAREFRKTHRQWNETHKSASVRAASSGRRFIHGWQNCTWATVKFAYFLFFLNKKSSASEMLSPYSLSRLQHFFRPLHFPSWVL